ncbi:MAG: hypothetical protein GY777_29695 [Candidatus Brocadiaceae bacterium]|nr:hypothetical protein [Candidatus Brocadiaceae bacterium]
MKMTVQQWMNSPEKPDIFKPFSHCGDIRCGLVLYDAEERVFRICIGAGYIQTYDMKADRILSGGGFLDFLLQVHSKEWITGQHLKDLLDCITCWVYRDHGGRFPQDFFDVTDGMNRGLDDPNII